MQIKRLTSTEIDLERLDDMVVAMREILTGRQHAAVCVEDVLALQDDDGSFKLLDSYRYPSDARVDYCHVPTYIGAAILMKAYVAGENHVVGALERALKASLLGGLRGHGYEDEAGRIEALRIFIMGGLHKFLETERTVSPEFHNEVLNILHEYNSRLLRGETNGLWGEDYLSDWKEICEQLKLSTRLYLAYGSNMDQSQMLHRCPGAKVVGRTYLEGWELTLPYVANIEPCLGKKTPGLIWEITQEDERALDRYEGYPWGYEKVNVLINTDAGTTSAMAYVMTPEHKNRDRVRCDEYTQRILRGYREAGFDASEFQPRLRS